jgi:hypothetical protein
MIERTHLVRMTIGVDEETGEPYTKEELVKPLTDEEIRRVADEVFKDYKNWHHYQIDFARAILAKACSPTIQGNTCG